MDQAPCINNLLLVSQGNHKKAMKLLNLSLSNGKSPVSPLSQSLFQNNLGCVHLMMNKPDIALYHIKNAMEAHLTAVKDDKELRERLGKDFQLDFRKLSYSFDWDYPDDE